MRSLEDLIDTADPALPLIEDWIAASPLHCELLPPSAERARVLSGLQVTTRSPLGAMAYETGGLLIDHGWLRLLGSGHTRLNRTIVDWNASRASGFLLVADDVLGGYFAINGGALGEDVGKLYYWAPDNLEWEALEIGHGDFMHWALSERLHAFYDAQKWPNWQADVAQLDGQQCFSFYPFLWTQEGSAQTSSRQAIDIAEHYDLNLELAAQLGVTG